MTASLPEQQQEKGMDLLRGYSVTLPRVQLHAPSHHRFSSEYAMKEWVWENKKEEIISAMQIEFHEGCSDEITSVQQNDRSTRHNGEIIDERIEIVQSQQASIQDRKRLELLDIIAKVQRAFFSSESPKVVFGLLLQALLDLTESEYGFIGEVQYEDDGTMFLQTHAITNIAWNQATQQFYQENIESGLKFFNLHSLFGTVMTTKEPVISNDPKSDPRACQVPEGHPPLNHFLGIPFFKTNTNVLSGMVGISNKPGGYSMQDIEFLEPFTVTCSNLIEAYRQIARNQFLINTLEESVKERTKELEEANKNLEKANRQIVENAKMKLEHFACMSHEIRTPLNCIIGMSSLLKGTPMNPMQEESVQMIVSSGELLLAVVNDVLDYSKLETRKVDLVLTKSSLQEILSPVLHSIQMKGMDQNLSLLSMLDTNLPEFIETDSRRLQQILFNLLGNAVKFSNVGGVIQFSVTFLPPFEPECTLAEEKFSQRSVCPFQNRLKNQTKVEDSNPGCPFQDRIEAKSIKVGCDNILQNGHGADQVGLKQGKLSDVQTETRTGMLRFQVKDFGKGIENKDFGRIFQPFHQAKSGETENVYGGTGLGLAITKKLVEGLQGSIHVDSEEGKWSEFTVNLPCAAKSEDIHVVASRLERVKFLVVGRTFRQGKKISDMISHFFVVSVTLNEVADVLNLISDEEKQSLGNVTYVCIVSEEMYDIELDKLVGTPSRFILITYGPKYCVPVDKTDRHFRFLDQIVPITFMNAVDELVKKFDKYPAAEKPPADNNIIHLKDLRVLVAEDNTINQKVLLRMLNRLGVTKIDFVDDGVKAVEKEASCSYDLILMDMQMPFMNGIAATETIMARKDGHKKAKVVFVTAHVSPDFEAQCHKAGGSAFLPKPFRIEDIELCFRQLRKSGLIVEP